MHRAVQGGHLHVLELLASIVGANVQSCNMVRCFVIIRFDAKGEKLIVSYVTFRMFPSVS